MWMDECSSVDGVWMRVAYIGVIWGNCARGDLWIELLNFSTEWVEAVGKRTKNSKNFVPMSACRTYRMSVWGFVPNGSPVVTVKQCLRQITLPETRTL